MTVKRKGKEITIRVVLDACGAMDDGAFVSNLCMFDNNRLEGSTGQGTNALATAVGPNDTVCWLLAPIECEAYFDLHSITFPEGTCTVERRLHEGTGVYCWYATVDRPIIDAPYEMTFILGAGLKMSNGTGTRLIGAGEPRRRLDDVEGVL